MKIRWRPDDRGGVGWDDSNLAITDKTHFKKIFF